MLSRRDALLGTLGLLSACTRGDSTAFASLARRSGGRLGVTALDTATGTSVGCSDDARFPMCSTFKLVLVAAVLARVDAGHEDLATPVSYGPDALLSYAPITRAHVDDGAMRLDALCAAAITVSDNTAANLLLQRLGGPPAVTAFFRRLGDGISRLDRVEPDLNSALPGDVRDTTTPRAMAHTVARLVTSDVLQPASRTRLCEWLEATRTGLARLRAGVPHGWRVGDKTGTGERNAMCDVAVVWPPDRAPVVIAAYLTGPTAAVDARNAVFADVTREALQRLRVR